MKEKLAPIHFMQHNRIKLQENLEEFLVSMFALEGFDAESLASYGTRSSNISLEEQIDHDNIHGWLESHLVANEKRLARLSKKVIETEGKEALKLAHAEYGRNVGETLKENIRFGSGQELYGYLNALLLDGMPCDRISELKETSENSLVWHNVKDIHGKYYEEAGLPGDLFYSLREAFLKSFLSVIGDLSYTLEKTDDIIVNTVNF